MWVHLEKVLDTPDQIVNIHFARADVIKLKILLRIKDLDLQLKRAKARMRISEENRTDKFAEYRT